VGLTGADGQPATIALYRMSGFQEVRINRGYASDVWVRIAGRQVNWSSVSSNARLRITYQDTLGTLASTINACRWRITLDGVQIVYFSTMDVDGVGGWKIHNGSHVAWALNVPPGPHEVVVEAQRGLYATECIAGWNTTGSFLSVEEIP
jgi:hypothetical protein